MKEEILKKYFEGKISAEVLNKDVNGSSMRTGFDTSEVDIKIMDEKGEYTVTINHLLNLCNDAIKGDISSENLNTIAFALIGSDYFSWNEFGEIGERVTNVIFEWDNPGIGFPLTRENLILWKEYLESGVHKLKG